MGFGLKNTAQLVERRRGERRSVAVSATVRQLTGGSLAIQIDILSAVGFLASIERPIAKGTILRVRFANGRTPHARVVWLADGKIGCEFLSRAHVGDLLSEPDPETYAAIPTRVFGSLRRSRASRFVPAAS